jgi:hypothetical protein
MADEGLAAEDEAFDLFSGAAPWQHADVIGQGVLEDHEIAGVDIDFNQAAIDVKKEVPFARGPEQDQVLAREKTFGSCMT